MKKLMDDYFFLMDGILFPLVVIELGKSMNKGIAFGGGAFDSLGLNSRATNRSKKVGNA